jgi:hypothetical protein
MFPTRLPYEPTNLSPCFVLRSRREINTLDAANSRLVNHWQTDDPKIQLSRKDISGAIFYMDMNPTASRLYREDIRQSQPFVIPSGESQQVRKTVELTDKINKTISTIQGIDNKYQESIKGLGYDDVKSGKISKASSTLKGMRDQQNEQYDLLLAQQKYIQTDSLSDNPYFNKYDVASDSRNIVRELRAAVSEDVVDRGLRESQRLLQRGFDNRWIPQGYAKEKGIDALSSFELMRPKFNDMGRKYN